MTKKKNLSETVSKYGIKAGSKITFKNNIYSHNGDLTFYSGQQVTVVKFMVKPGRWSNVIDHWFPAEIIAVYIAEGRSRSISWDADMFEEFQEKNSTHVV